MSPTPLAFGVWHVPAMWDLGLIPIADLCHFGVPDWVGGFTNPDWPAHFVEYAAAFAERYPWIKFYTPVKEMLVCARMSGLEGAFVGLSYTTNNFLGLGETLQIQASIGKAVYRDRTRSAPDKILGTHGDAAFADYVWLLSYSYRLPSGGKGEH